jgi:hypothetical protein
MWRDDWPVSGASSCFVGASGCSTKTVRFVVAQSGLQSAGMASAGLVNGDGVASRSLNTGDTHTGGVRNVHVEQP